MKFQLILQLIFLNNCSKQIVKVKKNKLFRKNKILSLINIQFIFNFNSDKKL